MNTSFTQRLIEAGIELPTPSRPAANYVPFRLDGSTLYIAGQLPLVDNQPRYVGCVPGEVGIEDAYAAARLCAINVLAQAGAALDGDFDRVTAVLKVSGFIRAAPDFGGHAQVMDGASDLFAAVFGNIGRHARTSVGVASLPRGAPVEIDAILAIRD